MKLSIIILNYNVRYFLEQSILSVKRATKNIEAEIIVIDNNSSDESCQMVKKHFPEVILIENKKNVGFSKANNQAVAVAKGEYVCILNPDTAVAEDAFFNCLAIAEQGPKIGALGPYLLDGTGNFLPESKRNVPTPKVSFLKLLGFSKSYYASNIPEENSGNISILVGAFMFLKRDIYNEVGGFDEDYFMYGEDIDLCYKIIKAGYQNYYIGNTEVLHYKGESTQKNEEYLDRFYGAMHIFYKKHLNTNVLVDKMVDTAVFFAKKRHSVPSPKILTSKIENAYVFTEDITVLKGLSEHLGIPLKSASKAIFKEEIFSNSMLIFDINYMSYSQVFSIMKRLKNRNNLFRICPSGCKYILGSDQSDQKGTVTVF